MAPIPADAIFAAHGLFDVKIDVPQFRTTANNILVIPTLDGFSSSDWLSGSARFRVQDSYPIFTRDGRSTPELVRFHYCPSDDQASLARFRRQCQILALGTLPSAPGPSTRFARVTEVLGWWEDAQGYWFIVEEERLETVELVEEWSRIMQDPGMEDVVDMTESLPTNVERQSHFGATEAERIFGEACQVLLSVVNALRGLHQRQMSIISCRPSLFSISHAADGELQVNLKSFDHTVPLPTFNIAALLKHHSNFATSPLFRKDPPDANQSLLVEPLLRKDLRYLAPEEALSKRVSLTGDIYSIGVLAYELITGSTIDDGPDSPGEADVDVLIDFHRHVTMQILPPREWIEREGQIGQIQTALPPRQLSDIIMRCLGKEPDSRYSSLESLAYDLSTFARICRAQGDLSKFNVGEIDDLARFSLPAQPVHRDAQLDALRNAFDQVVAKDGPNTRVVNVTGLTGSGKTRIVRYFVSQLESSNNPIAIAWAKLDESTRSPLSSFTQIFTSLLDRYMTDPNEDIKEWQESIRKALGPKFQLFMSLMPTEYWRMLGSDPDGREVDWLTLNGTLHVWAKQFLQLFASEKQPLVIVLDDIQWLALDEARFWRKMLDGPQPMSHLLVVSTSRMTEHQAPPSSLLSASTLSIDVSPLSEEGVHALLKVCFRDRIIQSQALASFIHAETGGSSMFTRTIISQLVKDEVILFDFDALTWRFDAVKLQSHLSKAGVDAYLERLILSVPPAVRELLFYVSCLPPKGFNVSQIAQLLNKDEDDVERLIEVATSAATLLVRANNNSITFAHDGPKAVAYRLIPPARAAEMHAEISTFLRQASFNNDYIFDAADHALIARELGSSADSDETMIRLLLTSLSRTALAASLTKAKQFFRAAQDIIDASGGCRRWMSDNRELYIRFLQVYAAIASVSKQFDGCSAKIQECLPYLKTPYERISVATTSVHLCIAAGKNVEACEIMFKTLKEHNYDPLTSIGHATLPKTPEDVEIFQRKLDGTKASKDDIRILVVSLIGAAGSSVYSCEPILRNAVFQLALALVWSSGKMHETTSFATIAASLRINRDIPMKKALVNLSRTIADQCPVSFLIGHVRTTIAAQTHYWTPWHELEDDYTLAIEGNISSANYEQATNAFGLYLGTTVISSKAIPIDLTFKRYDAIRPFVSAAGRYFIELPLQYAERVMKLSFSPQPWTFDGAVVNRSTMDDFLELYLHTSFRYVLALRLAVFYDAPLGDIEAIIEDGRKYSPAIAGLTFDAEWALWTGIVASRSGRRQADLQHALDELSANTTSPDFSDRLMLLQSMQMVHENVNETLEETEKAIDTLSDHGQHALAGLLSYRIAMGILESTKSLRLATGFLRTASEAYQRAQMFGVCEMMRERWPLVCPYISTPVTLPSQILRHSHHLESMSSGPPPLRRASISTSNETTASIHSSGNQSGDVHKAQDNRSFNVDQLDTLAMMRASLALAQEQDPPVLLCTLLRILCQLLRAEFAAIALVDESDNDHVRLRAAGPFSHIAPYDVRIVDEAARYVCPTSLILHTARTGKPITSVAGNSRFRSDPFYHSRSPRSVICLPISMQGKQQGVVVLSSMTIATTQTQWESAKEVISTLATFATIITSNVSFTKRLKLEVDQRTEELSNALAAKTQFLSQCSHELRSPLSAVLGLAAVLEASSGLSDVQREHLRTIISSGEDLLGLINNILDHSRLESGSVTLESIPFSLRDVVEGALDSVAAVAQKKNLEVCLINAFDTDPPGLIGDPFRIKQILLNLLSNAVKFTHEGRVTVRWRCHMLSEGKAKVEIDVEDTGIGIPAQKMDKLFRSFSQIDESITRSFGGSGLGLIISKDLAKLLGGDCTAESNYGSGSKFTFSLTADVNPNYNPTIRRFDGPTSCFVICSEGPWWQMLEENLKLLHVDPVRFADDPMECLVKSHPDGLNSKKQFDFILLDLQKVNKDVLAEMRRLQPKATLLYLVRSIDLTKIIRDYDISRDSIVSRPIKFTSLLRAMLPLPKDNSSSTHLDRSDRGKRKLNKKLAQTNPLEILLVDDNAVNVTVGKRILEMFGYKSVTSAADGQQAIDAAEKKHYDLILLDLQMPVVDGFTAQRRIRASPLAGDPCIVALTANADQATQQICEDEGFWGYLSKPLDIPRLERILGEVGEYRKQSRGSGGLKRTITPPETETHNKPGSFRREVTEARTTTVHGSEQGHGAAPGSKEMTMSEVRNARKEQKSDEADEREGKRMHGEQTGQSANGDGDRKGDKNAQDDVRDEPNGTKEQGQAGKKDEKGDSKNRANGDSNGQKTETSCVQMNGKLDNAQDRIGTGAN